LNQSSIRIYFPFFLKKGMTDRVPVKGNCVDNGPSFFFLKKGMTDRVPVKGNCVDNGPSLVAENIRPVTLCKILLIWWVLTFLVKHGIPPAGRPQILLG